MHRSKSRLRFDSALGGFVFQTFKLENGYRAVKMLPSLSYQPALSLQMQRAITIDPKSEALVRTLDVAVALAALIVFGPFMMMIAATIVASSRGPVFYRQKRLGLGGRHFTCLKFRTMHVDSDGLLARLLADCPRSRDEWERDQKLRKDPRVIFVGRFLRKTSLDELPQLLNVLRGDMSIVGPRPIVPSEAVRYGRYIGNYCAMRPGITGLWQVSGRNETTYRRRVACDVAYSRSQSALNNMRIIARTVPVVLRAKGAY